MHITREDILHLADLVKIDIAPDEADALGYDLDAVLGYIRLLDEVDTTGVEPLDALGVGVLRPDEPAPTLGREDLELLSGFDPVSGCFAVPAVFGDGGMDA